MSMRDFLMEYVVPNVTNGLM